MKVPISELKKHYNFQNPHTRMGQLFGNDFMYQGQWFYKERINNGLQGHNGIDYPCAIGTSMKAPEDMEISNVVQENVGNGYGTLIVGRTKPYEYNGATYRIEMIFGHLSNTLEASIGKWYSKGDEFALSGNTGPHTTGPHLHWGCRTVKATSSGGWMTVDGNNGYFGYWDQLPLINHINVEKPMKILKGATNPHIYLISSDDKRKIMLVDFPTLQVLQPEYEVVTEAELAEYEEGGTLIWTNRIIN